ncbi:MAG: DUF2027 domain-containing protein [Prevotellaceae bacterium]|jgi:hypothetical protein|nr:DUF2027 domain-containing protein [Prevotellaceae bacterium]
MMCSVGDTIRFLNDVGGGKVVKFIGKNQVLVEDADGFEIPVLISEVVVVNRINDEAATAKPIEAKRADAKPKQPVEKVKADKPVATLGNLEIEKEVTRENIDDYEILLGFYPKNQANPLEGDIDIYLINDGAYYLLYTVGVCENTGYIKHIQGGELEPDSKLYIQTLAVKDIATIQELSFGFMKYRAGIYRMQGPEQLELELNPVKFFRPNAFSENDFFDEKAMIYKLSSNQKTLKDFFTLSAEEIAKAMKEKKPHTASVKGKTPKPIEIEEVDLHIESLVDNHKDLSNGEILEIQLARFQTALELGMHSGTKRMVFIHGVGNGKLKHEILRLLDTQYAGKVRYQDASFKEYGYGATMVML